MRNMRWKVIMLTVMLLLIGIFGAASAQASLGDTYSVNVKGAFHYKQAYELLGEINSNLRRTNPLSMDDALLQSAMQRAAELSILYNNDVRPNGQDALSIQSKASASRVLFGYADSTEAYKAMNESSFIRSAMIGTSYNSVGIGCFTTGGNYYWVLLFSTENAAGINAHDDETRTVTISIVESYMGLLKAGVSGVAASEVSLYVGKTVDITPLWTDRSAGRSVDSTLIEIEDNSFNWTSSDSTVATVNSSGVIKAVGVGTAEITAAPKLGSGSGLSITVTVKKNTITSSLASDTYVYTGSKIYPAVTVKRGSRILQQGTDYTVSYKRNKKVGYGRVIVDGKGKYADQTETLYFKITPPQMTFTAKAYKMRIRFTWKGSSQASGYELKLATSRNMKEDLILREVDADQTRLVVKGLTRSTTYYVRMRTYKTVNGEKIYGKWSKRMKITTK